ncbi:Diphthamide biosynthesis protein 2 [Ananas comosus]|uniref:2-(3-amino-3-carboxypropyl)histidine synthase subunit 2 n=1 Tax=Ananas comosus TaxID=4615 RepID=A0A199V4E6_ANACO|nr:Diphthamide biosynthesis protein 2 [Ananas comosus]
MDFESSYDIPRTVDYICSRGYSRVVLQFPDELLRDSTSVAKALRCELGKGVRLYVMADTAYNSCCVDEIGASHVDAECVVHYGHACMSPTSTLPALFVFGKAPINGNACADLLNQCLSTTEKPVLVLYGLEYAHAMENLKGMVTNSSNLRYGSSTVHFAEVSFSSIDPPVKEKADKEQLDFHGNIVNGGDKIISEWNSHNEVGKYFLGGLTWSITKDHKMEDFLLFWIGQDNSAFANVVLTFNTCEIVRYDAVENQLLKDVSHQQRILKRRYYLVEKAKDANIVGILVGTLGVAGYLHIIQQMKELIEAAGKKSYTLVMGRPNSAKLANFPECEIFVYVSCAQTALLDSKDFLGPVITPFEAVLAFGRGRQWTGEYVLDFQDLMNSSMTKVVESREEARFSFIQGGYVEDIDSQENGEQKESTLALAEAAEKALSFRNEHADSILFKGSARSGAEYFAARSYRGLSTQYENPLPQSYLIGRSGRASGYEDERNTKGND